MLDSSKACYGFQEGEWVFDNSVVNNWLGEMEGHIPSYWHVINLSAEIVGRLHDKSARILSFWAATGNQFLSYLERGWKPENLFGLNYSKPLDDSFRAKFPDSQSRQVDIEERPYNPTIDAPFDVVQMHWSLHFEPLDKRTQLLQQIHDALNPGGTLLLTDKTLQSAVVESMYHDFKRSKGVSEEYIEALGCEGEVFSYLLVEKIWQVCEGVVGSPFPWICGIM